MMKKENSSIRQKIKDKDKFSFLLRIRNLYQFPSIQCSRANLYLLLKTILQYIKEISSVIINLRKISFLRRVIYLKKWNMSYIKNICIGILSIKDFQGSIISLFSAKSANECSLFLYSLGVSIVIYSFRNSEICLYLRSSTDQTVVIILFLLFV